MAELGLANREMRKPKVQKSVISKIPQNLTKEDLLKLLSLLEGELQARDIVILNMKADKERLSQAKLKYGKFSFGNPFTALQRDTDEGAVAGTKNTNMPCSPMVHLEALMEQHQKAKDKMVKQLKELDESHAKVVREYEEEKRKHAQDTAQGDDVTYMLEKERERLIQQVDFEKAQQKKLEKDTKRTQTLLKEEKLKHQQFVVLLVKERKRLASKLIEERQKNRELSQQLDMERGEVRSMAEGLMQEGKKSLKMEAEMEKYLSEFDIEREQLKAKLHREENRTKELRDEVSKLKHQILELEEQLRKSEHRIRGRDNQKSSVTSISMVSSVKDQGKSRSDPGMTDSKCDKRSVGATSPRPSKTSYTPTKPGSSYSIRTVEDESGKIEVKFTPKSGKTGIPVKHEGNSTNAAVAQGKPTVPVRLNTSPTSPTNPSSGKKSPVNPRGTPPPVPPNKPVFSPLSSFKKDANKNSPPAAVRPDSLVEARKQFYASKFGADGNIDNRQLSNANDSIGEGDHSPVSSPDSTSSGSSTSSVVMRPSKSTSPGSETGWEAASLTNATATMSDTENRNDTNVTDIEQILVNMTSDDTSETKDSAMPPVYAAAAGGKIDVLKKLLSDDKLDPNVSISDGITPLHAAAESGFQNCVEQLLKHKADANATRQGNFTPLHAAAGEGHHGCVKCLLEYGADASKADNSGWQPLHWAVFNGHSKCARYLIDYGASRNATTKDGWTPLHSAVQAGHVHCLAILLNHKPKTNTPVKENKETESSDMVDKLSPDLDKLLSESEESLEIYEDHSLVTADLLNAGDKDGWTLVHFAASKGFRDCLEMLCNNNKVNVKKRDKQDRVPYDVATDVCRELLDNLDARKVKIVIDMKGDTNISSTTPPPSPKEGDEYIIGVVVVKPTLSWLQFDELIANALIVHSKDVGITGRDWEDTEVEASDENCNFSERGLGLTGDSILCYNAGAVTWYPEEDNDESPFEFFSDEHRVTIQLMGLSEGCLDKLAYESLIPIQTLQNYHRLIEQYKSVVFYGPPGTGKTYVARKLAECIKHKQKQNGVDSDISHVALNPKYTRDDLFKLLHSKGFLISTKENNIDDKKTIPILVLDDLSRISLSEVLSELIYAVEYRGPANTINMKIDDSKDGENSSYYLQEDCYVLGTMDKARSTGLDLSVQQKFRWVNLKCDNEPVRGLLQRHLRRRLIHKYGGKQPPTADPVYKAVEWIGGVWQRLNACLTKLGLSELVLGPRHFFACPIEVNKPKAILRWLSLSWNHAIAPGVEDAVLRGCTSVMQGHHKVATTALFVLLQRAVVPGCPLSQQEAERYLSSFRGGNIGSFHLSIAKKNIKSSKKTQNFGWKHGSAKESKKKEHTRSKDSDVSARGTDTADSDDATDNIEITKDLQEEIARKVLEALNQPSTTSEDTKTTSLTHLQNTDEVMKALLTSETSKSDSEVDKIMQLHDQLFGQVSSVSKPSKLKISNGMPDVPTSSSLSKISDILSRERAEVEKTEPQQTSSSLEELTSVKKTKQETKKPSLK